MEEKLAVFARMEIFLKDPVKDATDLSGQPALPLFCAGVTYLSGYKPQPLKLKNLVGIPHLHNLLSLERVGVSYLHRLGLNGKGREVMVIENAFADHPDILYKEGYKKVGQLWKAYQEEWQSLTKLITALEEKATLIQKQMNAYSKKKQEGEPSNPFIIFNEKSKYKELEKQLEDLLAEIQHKEEQTLCHLKFIDNLNHGSHVSAIISQVAPGVTINPILCADDFSYDKEKFESLCQLYKQVKRNIKSDSKQNQDSYYSSLSERLDERSKAQGRLSDFLSSIPFLTKFIGMYGRVVNGSLSFNSDHAVVIKSALKLLQISRRDEERLLAGYNSYDRPTTSIFLAAGNEGQFLTQAERQTYKDKPEIHTDKKLSAVITLVGNYNTWEGWIEPSSNLPDKSKTNYVLAPGSQILADVVSADNSPSYEVKTGTSMAAPFVSGIAALLEKYFPDVSNALIKSTLLKTAERLAQGSHPELEGNGLINAKAAFEELNRIIFGEDKVNVPYEKKEILRFLVRHIPEINYEKAVEIADAALKVTQPRFQQRIAIINSSYDYVLQQMQAAKAHIGTIQSSLKTWEDLKNAINKFVIKEGDPASKILSYKIYNSLLPLYADKLKAPTVKEEIVPTYRKPKY